MLEIRKSLRYIRQFCRGHKRQRRSRNLFCYHKSPASHLDFACFHTRRQFRNQTHMVEVGSCTLDCKMVCKMAENMMVEEFDN